MIDRGWRMDRKNGSQAMGRKKKMKMKEKEKEREKEKEKEKEKKNTKRWETNPKVFLST